MINDSTEPYVRAIREIRDKIPLTVLKDGERFSKPLKSLKKGSVIKIFGEVFCIETVYAYREEDVSWDEFDLRSVPKGKTVFLDFSGSNSEISIWEAEKATIGALGVSPSDLQSFFKKGKGSFNYQGNSYDFIYKGDAVATSDSGAKSDFSYYYFTDSLQQNLISIQEWEPGKFTVSVGKKISKDDYEVLAV